MNAADSSCGTWMKRSLSSALRRFHYAVDAVSGWPEDNIHPEARIVSTRRSDAFMGDCSAGFQSVRGLKSINNKMTTNTSPSPPLG